MHASAPEVVKNCEILSATSKAAKSYLQQNTNFLKLIASTKNRNSILAADDASLLGELNASQQQANKLITNYYTIEEMHSKSTKSLLKTSAPVYTPHGEPPVTPLNGKSNHSHLGGYASAHSASSHLNSGHFSGHSNGFVNGNRPANHSDIDLPLPSQRLNSVEPTAPSNQLQLNLDLLENAMLIKCQPGFNGGLKQIFFLEIYDIIEQRLYLNITSVENPVFLLTELKSNTKFNLNIYAANVKGRSSSVNLNFHTFQPQISNAKKQGKD